MSASLKTLAASETALVQSIRNAVVAVDRIGTDRVSSAVADLDAALLRAKIRLQAQLDAVAALIGTACNDFTTVALAIDNDLQAMKAERTTAPTTTPTVADDASPRVASETPLPCPTAASDGSVDPGSRFDPRKPRRSQMRRSNWHVAGGGCGRSRCWRCRIQCEPDCGRPGGRAERQRPQDEEVPAEGFLTAGLEFAPPFVVRSGCLRAGPFASEVRSVDCGSALI
jgi:hypothetical protein